MKNDFMTQVYTLIRMAIEQSGSLSALSREVGTSKANISNWANEKTAPNTVQLAPIADLVGARLLLPEQSVRDYARLLHVRDIDASRHATDVRNGQNVPLDVLEYVGNHMHHRPELLFSLDLLKKIGVDAHDALIFSPESDVMHPIISRGDQVLVDKTRTAIEDGKIYLVHTGEYFLIRRISRELNGDLILQAETSVPNMTITPELRPRINILGEVVWVGKKL